MHPRFMMSASCSGVAAKSDDESRNVPEVLRGGAHRVGVAPPENRVKTFTFAPAAVKVFDELRSDWRTVSDATLSKATPKARGDDGARKDTRGPQ